MPAAFSEVRNLRLELLLLADVGMLGLPNAGKSTFIRAVSSAKPKVADYPFTTLVPNLGVVRTESSKSFVIADIPGLIEGAAEGAGLGIQFLKHLERCGLLLHMIDVLPADGSDPAENAQVIIHELGKYSDKLANKPRWLVFNKIDLVLDDELDVIKQNVIDTIGWEGPVYQVSAASRTHTEALCRDIQAYLDQLPKEAPKEQLLDPVQFKWDDYHADAMNLADDLDDDDDFDDDDYEVEVIYRR